MLLTLLLMVAGPGLLVSLSAASAAPGFEPAEAPSAPATIETAYTRPGVITVYWSPPRSGSVTGYSVFRDGVAIAHPGPADRSYLDAGLIPATVYRYRVEADYPDGKLAATHTIAEKLPPLLTSNAWYDLIVSSASSAGVAAAVTAAHKGLRVALIEPTDRLGGIMSNGLCSTDIRRPEHSTGFFEAFRRRIQAYYGSGQGLRYEPHVVNNVLKGMVAAEPRVDVYFHVRPTGVILQRGIVAGIKAVSLDTGMHCNFHAPMTIDASPTADVTAWAGCRCRVGREPRSASEPHAGVIYYDRAHNLLLPGSTGRGDRRLMAYAYLLVVKDYGPNSDRTIARPEGYKERDYIHSPSWKDSWAFSSGAMPAGKYELNQHPEGNDLQEVNYRWPWENATQRARTEKAFRDHAMGYLYYLQTHDGLKNLGLPDDEFPENGGFPETLYVREARRVVGMCTLTEHDVTDAGALLRTDAGGIGDYPMDSHAVRPKTNWATPDMGEGEYWLYRQTPWYQIPIGVVIPADRDGLLVAEAVSATHVGYGTLRLEPVRMEMGELCGLLAALSASTGARPRDLPPTLSQDWLSMDGQQVFWHADVAADRPGAPAIQWMSEHGVWTNSDFKPGQPVTRHEALSGLKALAELEVRQERDPASRESALHFNWGALPADDAPLLRRDLATWLQALQSSLFPVQWPLLAGADLEQYPDLPHGTELRKAAIALAQHHIDIDTWRGLQMGAGQQPLFQPDLPVTRAEFVRSLYLAQRPFPGSFFQPVSVIVQPYRAVPRVP